MKIKNIFLSFLTITMSLLQNTLYSMNMDHETNLTTQIDDTSASLSSSAIYSIKEVNTYFSWLKKDGISSTIKFLTKPKRLGNILALAYFAPKVIDFINSTKIEKSSSKSFKDLGKHFARISDIEIESAIQERSNLGSFVYKIKNVKKQIKNKIEQCKNALGFSVEKPTEECSSDDERFAQGFGIGTVIAHIVYAGDTFVSNLCKELSQNKALEKFIKKSTRSALNEGLNKTQQEKTIGYFINEIDNKEKISKPLAQIPTNIDLLPDPLQIGICMGLVLTLAGMKYKKITSTQLLQKKKIKKMPALGFGFAFNAIIATELYKNYSQDTITFISDALSDSASINLLIKHSAEIFTESYLNHFQNEMRAWTRTLLNKKQKNLTAHEDEAIIIPASTKIEDLSTPNLIFALVVVIGLLEKKLSPNILIKSITTTSSAWLIRIGTTLAIAALAGEYFLSRLSNIAINNEWIRKKIKEVAETLAHNKLQKFYEEDWWYPIMFIPQETETSKKTPLIKPLTKAIPFKQIRPTKPVSLKEPLLNSLIEGDGRAFAQIIRRYITNLNEEEAFDSAVKILGFLHNSYAIQTDKKIDGINIIILIPKNRDHRTVIIGLKQTKNNEDLKELALNTLTKTRTYALKLRDRYRALTIFAIGFTQENLVIEQEEL